MIFSSKKIHKNNSYKLRNNKIIKRRKVSRSQRRKRVNMGPNIIVRKKVNTNRKKVMIILKKLEILLNKKKSCQNLVMKKLRKLSMIRNIESLLKSMDMLTFSIFRFCPRLKRSSSWLSRERKCKKIADIMDRIILLPRLVNVWLGFKPILN